MAEEITTITPIEGTLEWTERPIAELVDRYGEFYLGLTQRYGILSDHAAQITAAIASSEQMSGFGGFLPEIETAIEIEEDSD